MGLLRCLLMVSMLSGQLVLTSPLTDGRQFCTKDGRVCEMCPAGEYQKSCVECESCPAGFYTTALNCEDDCHPCYADCRPDFHLKVAQNCTSTSDVKCVCEDGYRCSELDSYSSNCRYCVKIEETTRTEAAAVTSDKNKHTLPSASSARSSTSSKHCQFPKCGHQSAPPTGNGTHLKGDETSGLLAAILCPVVAVGCLVLVILFFLHCLGEETCFKRAIAKLCNEGRRDAFHKPMEPTHRFAGDSFSEKQQPAGLSAANLGPVHVHNPATVIFSLLSQFTGHVGPTVECGKTAERVISEEDDERDCPVFHPTSSPSIPLSEEERSGGKTGGGETGGGETGGGETGGGETGGTFFPSQEQGKDCHVSKEEML